MANPVQEGRIEKAFKKIKADFFLENGRMFYRTEEEGEEIKHDLIEELQHFDGRFCTLSMACEVKYDTLEEETEEVNDEE